MRRSLLVFAALCCGYTLQAQKLMSITVKDPVICYANAQNNPHYLAPPEEYLNRKNRGARTNTANIEVKYIGFEGIPQAQQAFNRAVEIWESLLTTSVTIHIEARWTPLAAGVLGSANYTSAYANFNGAQKINVFYPVAIAEKITGQEMNGADQPDILANFSSVFDWHFDPDTAPPVGKYDLTTIVLHELCHGLGFSGSLRVSGTSGLFGLASTGLPIIYDVPIESFTGDNLIETILSPSIAMTGPLTSSGLFFNAASGRTQLYAPSTYDGGSSVSHLDETMYGGTSPDKLMTPFIAAQEQLNNPGLAYEMLKDLGWETIKINHQKLSGTENVAGPYPVIATIYADNGYNPDRVTLHYTTGSTFTTLPMTPSGPAHTFSADIPGDGAAHNYYYFISVENEDGVEYVVPGKRVRPLQTQLQLVYGFEVGPDTRAPLITHEQKPFLLDSETELEIIAEISDNTGSVTAVVEYLVNDVPQTNLPLVLTTPEQDSIYTATLNISALVDGDKIKYRIKATDNSSNQNVAYSPAENYYTLSIVGYGETQDSYQTDFETAASDADFFGTGYSIVQASGFNNRAIHSEHPYLSGDGFPGNERSLIYQLRIPIRVKAAEATIKFDEIALVETGAPGSVFGDEDFFDYVIVEGSNDGGQTWMPLLPGYDANARTAWLTRYNSAIDNTTGNSTALGDPTLYYSRTIDMLQTFNEGDEVVIRFRTYIDQLANAWGWAIDNLKIQIDETPPLILHDHFDFIQEGTEQITLISKVSDASEVSKYTLELYINNENPQTLDIPVGGDMFSPYETSIDNLGQLSNGDVIHYRFIAEDEIGNMSTFPSDGFIKIAVVEFGEPVSEYVNDFNSVTTDFVGNFFSITTPSGFSSGGIHSDHSYPTGMGLNSTSSFSYLLTKPVIISENNPVVLFKEIVLVEGHAVGVVFGSDAFKDYVIVEGSTDQGETWANFQEGYDAVGVAPWVSATNNNSSGTPALFRSRSINMTSSGNFDAGDEVLIRFRLFSNENINKWGWAIDDLYIQNLITGVETVLEKTTAVYPNPARGQFMVEATGQSSFNFTIEVMNMQGQKLYEAREQAANGKMVHTISAQPFATGMYIVRIKNGNDSVVRKILITN